MPRFPMIRNWIKKNHCQPLKPQSFSVSSFAFFPAEAFPIHAGLPQQAPASETAYNTIVNDHQRRSYSWIPPNIKELQEGARALEHDIDIFGERQGLWSLTIALEHAAPVHCTAVEPETVKQWLLVFQRLQGPCPALWPLSTSSGPIAW